MARTWPRPAPNSRHELGARSYGLIGLLSVLAMAGRFGRTWFDENHWAGALLLALVLILPYAIWRSVRSDRRYNQKCRDATLLADLDRGYGVFLRPFHLDATLRLENPFARFWGGDLAEVFPLYPGEYVSRVLEPFFAVAEIGGTQATIGSSRVQTDEADWQQTFHRMIEAARFLVIMPLLFERADGRHGEATLWELAQLVGAAKLERVVVFMPRPPGPRSAVMARAWESARAAAAGQGIDLPAYTRRGGVFTLSTDGARWRASVDWATGRYRGRALAGGLVKAVQRVAVPI
jgi:hypothetical protein